MVRCGVAGPGARAPARSEEEEEEEEEEAAAAEEDSTSREDSTSLMLNRRPPSIPPLACLSATFATVGQGCQDLLP